MDINRPGNELTLSWLVMLLMVVVVVVVGGGVVLISVISVSALLLISSGSVRVAVAVAVAGVGAGAGALAGVVDDMKVAGSSTLCRFRSPKPSSAFCVPKVIRPSS